MTSRYDGILIDCVLYLKCFNAPRKEKKFTKEELRVAKLCSFKLLHGISICVSQLFGNPQNQRCDSDSYCCRPHHSLASDIGYSQSSLARTSECCLLLQNLQNQVIVIPSPFSLKVTQQQVMCSPLWHSWLQFWKRVAVKCVISQWLLYMHLFCNNSPEIQKQVNLINFSNANFHRDYRLIILISDHIIVK